MISNQRVEDLAKEIRNGEVRIDLDSVKICSPQGVDRAVSWPHFLTIKNGQFVCNWRVPRSETGTIEAEFIKLHGERPDIGKIVEGKDNFHLSAITPNGIPIEIDDLVPFPSVSTHSDGPTKYSTGFQFIKVPAMGDETWDSERIRARWNRLNQIQADQQVPTNVADKIETLFAIIPSVKLLISSACTEVTTKHPFLGEAGSSAANCLVDEIHGGKFCVEAKNGDLWVYFRRALVDNAPTVPTSQKVFSGILASIGFTHGCHPWPYYWQHVRDHVVVDRWLRCCPDCARDPLLPIESRRMSGSNDARDLFRKACIFFSAESEEAALTIRALWLMRESNRDSMPFEIRLVALCSILDGLIDRLGSKLLTQVELSSIKGKLRSVERCRKWKLIMDRLQLPWNAVFEPAWKSWEQFRHPLAHGFNEVPEQASETIFDAYSRITGAIYILMAKSMGYTGDMTSSLLEDKFVSLGTQSPAASFTPVDRGGSEQV